MCLSELGVGDRSNSLRSHLAKAAPGYKDIDGLMRQFRNGEPLPDKVKQGLQTEAHLVVMSADRLDLPVDIKAFRKVILTTDMSELPGWIGDFQHLLERAGSDFTRRAHLQYVLSLAFTRQFQVGSDRQEREDALRRAKVATQTLMDVVQRASQLPLIWRHLAGVNDMSLAWQVASANKGEFEGVLQRALPVYRAAADAFPFWVRVRRDELETLALLRSRGFNDVGQTATDDEAIDLVIHKLTAQFRNMQGLYCLAMLHDNLEAEALAVIGSRPIYKKLRELFGATSMAKVTGDVLLSLKSLVVQGVSQ